MLGALTGLLMLLAPLIMRIFGLGDLEELATTLSRILFPVVVLMGVSGIVVGILNSYEEFTVQALMPVLWNVAIIISLLFVAPRFESEEAQLYVYAGGVLVGTIIQTVTPVWWLRGRDGRIRAVLDLRDPAVKRVLTLMLPVTLGIGLINFNLVVNTFFAARFVDPQLAPSAIDAAFRIYMLPQGMFSVAVATVLFPRLSRLAARHDTDGFRSTVSLGLRQIGFLLLPASAIAVVLAEPIVRVLYQRGEFTAEQTPVVAGALAAFALGLTFNGTMLMLNRSFFSLQSPWIPTWVALGNLVLNARAGRDPLPRRRLGDPLGDVARQHRRNPRPRRAPAPPARASGRRGDPLLVRPHRGRVGWRRPLRPSACGTRSTRRSGARSARRSFRWASASLAGTAIFLAAAALLRVRELQALRSLRRRSGTTD